MSAPTVQGYDEALKIVQRNQSPRYRRLETFEKWAMGCQYDHLQSWWDDSGNVPLWERAPCVVYPLVQIAIASNVDLVFGEGRFPVFTGGAEDEGSADGGLSTDQTQLLDRFIRDYQRLGRFKSHCREGFAAAQAAGTICGLYGVRNDRPFSELVPAKWATPKLGPEGEVLSLDIRYPYLDEYRQPDGQWAVRAMLYRRFIDHESDTVFLPAVAREDGKEPAWKVDPSQTVRHDLGFCPAVWYRFMKGCQAVNVIDGRPIHALLLDEIRDHDIALSQRHRGALYSEPQIWETGVSPGYVPTDPGQSARIPATLEGGDITGKNPQTSSYVDGSEPKPARKKGPGYVWQYQSHETKVGAIVYPGDALKSQDDNARDLRIKLQEALAVVLLDPEHLKLANQTSGKALEAIKQKQLDRCDQYRDDLEDNFLTPSLEMQSKIAQKVRPKKVRSLPKALPILAKEPEVRTVWGPYNKPDPEEQKKYVDLVRAALGETPDQDPLITKKIAVQKIASIFDIQDIDSVIEEIEKEAEERLERAHEMMSEQAENDDEGREGSPGAQEPPAAA